MKGFIEQVALWSLTKPLFSAILLPLDISTLPNHIFITTPLSHIHPFWNLISLQRLLFKPHSKHFILSSNFRYILTSSIHHSLLSSVLKAYPSLHPPSQFIGDTLELAYLNQQMANSLNLNSTLTPPLLPSTPQVFFTYAENLAIEVCGGV